MVTAAPVYDQLVCFGDSQTQYGFRPGGFVGSLADAYQRRFDVIDRGYGGYTTDQGVILAPQIFKPLPADHTPGSGGKVELVIIWLGTNDSCQPGFPQHVPVERTESNTRQMVNHILSTSGSPASTQRILLLTPAAIVPSTNVGHPNNEYKRPYADAILGVADEYSKAGWKCKGLDALQLFLDEAQKTPGGLRDLLVEDGLHISEKGYKVLFKAIMETIVKEWPELDPASEALPLRAPSWRDIMELPLEEQRQKVRFC